MHEPGARAMPGVLFPSFQRLDATLSWGLALEGGRLSRVGGCTLVLWRAQSHCNSMPAPPPSQPQRPGDRDLMPSLAAGAPSPRVKTLPVLWRLGAKAPG